MMKRFALVLLALLYALSLLQAQTVSVSPRDNGQALVNPGMGWMLYYYSNVLDNYGSQLLPEDTVDEFEGVGVVFMRLPWAFLEPEKGKFNWEIIDTPAQRWIEKGKRIALCITSTENWTRQGTPQWVFDEGARCYEVDGFLEPEYSDRKFLQAVEHCVEALAARYDGDPNVDFVAVGHFGMWGEGHTVLTTPKHGKEWGFRTKKKYIDIYTRHFKSTQLCISDDIADPYIREDHFKITDYAFKKGVTLKDDSILVQPWPNSWFHDGMAQQFWPTLPVILEHEHYLGSVARKAWDKELLLRSVEDYHASYMSIHCWPHLEWEENKDIIRRINRRMGYRFQLEKAEWPSEVKRGEAFTITSSWKNAGVAPCYRGGYPCFTVKNDNGGIVAVLVNDGFNVNVLQPAAPGEAEAVETVQDCNIAQVFSNTKGNFSRVCQTGEFSVYVSVGKVDGTPVYELPYDGNDGHKRYYLGKITIK